METIDCNPDRQNTTDCPVFVRLGICFADRHHLVFPRAEARHGEAREQRSDPDYQVDICRALHNAIHASGYKPELPTNQTPLEERSAQLLAGEIALESYLEHYFND